MSQPYLTVNLRIIIMCDGIPRKAMVRFEHFWAVGAYL